MSAFGVPEMTPPLRDKPVGSVPTETDQVSGVVPPLSGTLNVYAVPLVPAAGKGLAAIAGSGLTVICTLAALVESVTDVAVTVAVKVLVTVAGAL